MISKFLIAIGVLLAVACTADADAGGCGGIGPCESWLHGTGPREAWLRGIKTQRNIHNAEKWIDRLGEYFVAPGNETLAALAELIDTENFFFSPQPRSVSNTLVPWASFAPVSNFLIDVVGGFTSFSVTYRADPVGNERKVVLFPESAGQSGLKGAYEQQYVVSISFNDEGKIVLYEEFVDSLYTCGVYGSAVSGCPTISA